MGGGGGQGWEPVLSLTAVHTGPSSHCALLTCFCKFTDSLTATRIVLYLGPWAALGEVWSPEGGNPWDTVARCENQGPTRCLSRALWF